MAILTKSRFQSGRQCLKRLWLEKHSPALAETDPSQQARLDAGTHFGEVARTLLGGSTGVLVDAAPHETNKALAQTREFLAQPQSRRPMLFEAAFEHEDVLVRVDALQCKAQADHLIEVKSSTSVKEEHLWDCAIQAWVLRGAGRPVKAISVAHIDNTFVYKREGDYQGLLQKEALTEQIEALLPEVPEIVAELKAVVAGPKPRIATGRHCSKPYPCPFFNHCHGAESHPEYPIEDIGSGKKLLERLRGARIDDLRKAPLEWIEKPRARRIAQASRTAKPVVSMEFASQLDAIPFPRYYLDFETIAYAVPRWLGTKPWKNIPFQFSCHVEQSDGSLEHRQFLDLSGRDPRVDFVDALLAAAGKTGPIIVWNQSFEAGRVCELAEAFPEQAAALLGLTKRMVDLLPIYKENYYHRDMHGSWSIKSVLPTVAPDLDYATLEICDGGMAQDAYARAIAADTNDAEREAIRRNLLEYCERDTWAMVRLARWRPEKAKR
ncbi:DUF2779 domain-containing protein [Rudaea sp.]|uniref:DUF2779 domain-containing protein n=1 Tax=Rudaea sp. TaxID=2136325 RepID=UPI003784A1E8